MLRFVTTIALSLGVGMGCSAAEPTEGAEEVGSLGQEIVEGFPITYVTTVGGDGFRVCPGDSILKGVNGSGGRIACQRAPLSSPGVNYRQNWGSLNSAQSRAANGTAKCATASEAVVAWNPTTGAVKCSTMFPGPMLNTAPLAATVTTTAQLGAAASHKVKYISDGAGDEMAVCFDNNRAVTEITLKNLTNQYFDQGSWHTQNVLTFFLTCGS